MPKKTSIQIKVMSSKEIIKKIKEEIPRKIFPMKAKDWLPEG